MLSIKKCISVISLLTMVFFNTYSMLEKEKISITNWTFNKHFGFAAITLGIYNNYPKSLSSLIEKRREALREEILKFKLDSNLQNKIKLQYSLQLLDTRIQYFQSKITFNLKSKKTKLLQKNTTLNDSMYRLCGQQYLLSDLGFRPFAPGIKKTDIVYYSTVITENRFITGSESTSKWCLKKAIDTFLGINMQHYYVDTQPLFPWKFIYESYKDNIQITENLRDRITKGKEFDPLYIQKWAQHFIASGFTGGNKPDNFSLIFGLQPGVYKKYESRPQEYEPEQIALFFDHPERYQYLLLPGMRDLTDTSNYIRLYAMMLEYTLCKALPTKYMEYMAFHIIQNFIAAKKYTLSEKTTQNMQNLAQKLFIGTTINLDNLTCEKIPKKDLNAIMSNFLKNYVVIYSK